MKASENKYSGKQSRNAHKMRKNACFHSQCSLVTLAHVRCLVCGKFLLKKSPCNFKVGSWKVLEKYLNFWPEKVYEPCCEH